MAYTAMPDVAIVYGATVLIVMANTVTACIAVARNMACIDMACIANACMSMAYIVMAACAGESSDSTLNSIDAILLYIGSISASPTACPLHGACPLRDPRRSFWVPARPSPRNGHAVGDAEMPM